MSETGDVRKAAEAAQDAAMKRCKAEKLAVYEYPFGSGRAKEVLDEEIARAILAERERCAKIADSHSFQAAYLNSRDVDVMMQFAAVESAAAAIAAAIRSGE